jgi:hypothetical protein
MQQTLAIDRTILMLCPNGAETLAVCDSKALRYLGGGGVVGELLIADNGRTIGRQEIAGSLGAPAVDIAEQRCDSALCRGADHVRGTNVIMVDADESNRFSIRESLVQRLRPGVKRR